MESKVHHTSGDVSGRRVKGTHLAPATIMSPHRTPSLLLSSVLTLSQLSNPQYSPLPGLARLPRPRLLSSTILRSSSVLPVPGPPLINTPLHGKLGCSFRYYHCLLLYWATLHLLVGRGEERCWWTSRKSHPRPRNWPHEGRGAGPGAGRGVSRCRNDGCCVWLLTSARVSSCF